MGIEVSVNSIFPTPVYSAANIKPITKFELDFVEEHKSKSRMNQGCNSSSVDSYILEQFVFKDLKNTLEQHLEEYLKKIICPAETSIKIYITQSWFNYTESNQFLQRHAHQNSFISGVYYVAADKEVDKIEFFKAGYDTIMLEYEKYNLFNSTSWNIPIETGNVILFPSHLVHGVDNKKGPNLRISLAFNVFLSGHIGSDEKIMQLKLK